MTTTMPMGVSIRKLDYHGGLETGYSWEPANPSTTLPEYDGILRVLSAAFAGDSFTAAVHNKDPADEDYSYATPFLMSPIIGELLSPGGEVYVAEVDATDGATKEIVGVCGWFAPGYEMFASDTEQKYALFPFVGTLTVDLQDWWRTTFLPRWEGFLESSFGPNGNHTAWTLQTLAVHPDYHRRGIARMLLQPVFDKAQGEGGGAPMCVVTTKAQNLEVYRKLGFALIPTVKGGEGQSTEECKHVFRSLRGVQVPVWVLARGKIAGSEC
ncbi:N-acetyltransferase domain-containing protein [Mycena kentingensis (nom. inval.)]|nr:N-acetyltransferase domain-containing protein [Mycena kentingensis (nom. inval.)]